MPQMIDTKAIDTEVRRSSHRLVELQKRHTFAISSDADEPSVRMNHNGHHEGLPKVHQITYGGFSEIFAFLMAGILWEHRRTFKRAFQKCAKAVKLEG